MDVESRMKPQHDARAARGPVPPKPARESRRAWRVLAALAALFLAAAVAVQFLSSDLVSVGATGPYPNPHIGNSATTDTCAACHRTHEGQNDELVKSAPPQRTLCLTCHDGTGAASNVSAEFSGIPANDPLGGKYYAHPVMDASASTHTSALSDEFYGVSNRHSECTDCHNPHKLSSAVAAPLPTGWTVSGALTGVTGVSGGTTQTWLNPVAYEYQLCLKCHSRYTNLIPGATDKAAEFATTNASLHPIEAAGKNTSAAMNASLAGGKLWNTFTATSTIRCTNCHADSRLITNPPAVGTPAPSARLAPHASANPGILLANYQDRVLKTSSAPYTSNDFALCMLCHREAAYSTNTALNAASTNFVRGTAGDDNNLHYLHVMTIHGNGNPDTDIKNAGAGQGDALCAECHYNTHGATTTQHLVTFAPNVQGYPTLTAAPLWAPGTTLGGTCTLTCHGKQHGGGSDFTYPTGTATPTVTGGTLLAPASAPATPTSTATPTPTPTNTPTPTPTPRPVKATPTPAPMLAPVATPTSPSTPTPAPTP